MVKIIYLDDLNQFIYPADILINYNIFAKKLPYTSLYPENTKLLLGCRYVPLRDEFTGKKKRYSPQAMDILITTGGADPYRIAEQLIMNIHRSKELKEINLHVVAGPLSKNTSELLCMAEEDPKVKLYQNVTNMAELMINCDVAVSAGGSTLYELCSCGIPAVSFSYADNQLAAVKEFHEQGMIFYAGDMREDPNGCLDTLIRELRELCRDEHKREKLSRRMKELVDGSGACRIADQLLIL